jgi:uncharacterized protein
MTEDFFLRLPRRSVPPYRVRRTDARFRTLAKRATLPLVIGAALGSYAFLIEPRWLQRTTTQIRIAGLHPDLQGLRIGLLTDLHAGQGTSLRHIRRACRLMMRSEPDVIAITGDLIADDAGTFLPVIEALAGVRAPLGVYAVPGNHDHIVGIDLWRSQIRETPNIRDLTNRSTLLRVGAARLCVAGVDDFAKGSPRLGHLPPAHKRDATVLLAHNPDQAEYLCGTEDRIDLVLSGHTHGGQVRVPGIGAVINPAVHDDIYEDGLHLRPRVQVYVSRGVGTVRWPVRFHARPEVAILELSS